MKTVLLLGGVSRRLSSLSHHQPRAMLPVGNRPALEHLFEHWSAYGLQEFFVPLSPRYNGVREHFEDGRRFGVRLHYATEEKWLGTAGCLTLFRDALRESAFLVINANAFSFLDPTPLLRRSPATPFLYAGTVEGKAAHVYSLHPGLLSGIPAHKYFDLAGQLVPWAVSQGCDVQQVPLAGSVNELRHFQDYLEAHHAIARPKAAPSLARHSDRHIASTATLSDPLLIGPQARIGDDSVVIDPAVIGAGCRIGRDVRVRQSMEAPRLFDFYKRAMDIALTLAAAPVLAPVCGLLALIVKVTSPGPALYREVRLGKGARPFTLFKLRTMVSGAHLHQEKLAAYNQADGPMFKIERDPRVTPIGRWLRRTSLDELPQFWNVLKGDMSLVGPRPLAAREMKWNPAWREIRLMVRPGLTGPWQVHCSGHSAFADWIDYDVSYVRHRSLFLDFRILSQTLRVVFKGRPAAAPSDPFHPSRRVDQDRYDVVVSIVHHNTPDVLKRCLDALQTEGSGLRTKIVVVDNASSPALTPERLAVWPDVALIANSRNVGFGRANNQVFRAYRASAYLVLNPDVQVSPGSLAFLWERLQGQPDVGAIGVRQRYPDGRRQSSCRRYPTLRSLLLRGFLSETRAVRWAPIRRYLIMDQKAGQPSSVDWVLGSCLFLRKEALRQAGGFDEKFFLYYEDIDLCYRLNRAGWRVEYNPKVEWIHDYRRTSAAAGHWKIRAIHFRSALRFLVKHVRTRGWRASL